MLYTLLWVLFITAVAARHGPPRGSEALEDLVKPASRQLAHPFGCRSHVCLHAVSSMRENEEHMERLLGQAKQGGTTQSKHKFLPCADVLLCAILYALRCAMLRCPPVCLIAKTVLIAQIRSPSDC